MQGPPPMNVTATTQAAASKKLSALPIRSMFLPPEPGCSKDLPPEKSNAAIEISSTENSLVSGN